MKKYLFVFACLLLRLLFIGHLQAQVHGNSVYGESLVDLAGSICLGANDRATIGGSSTFSLHPVRVKGILILESPTLQGVPQVAANFDLGNGTAKVNGLSSNSFGFTQAVGVCKLSTQTDDDGFFMNIGSSLVPQHTFFYQTPGDDRPAKVMTLADGTFAIVGSVVTNNVSSSFVTRIGAPQPYALQFHQVIGNPANAGFLVDEAVAVAQMASGDLLVAGNTRHFSTSAQGSLYLAKITLSGVIKEFHTYTIGGGVLEPRARDMIILADGSVVVVGQTDIPNDPDFFGFIMRVAADLNTATFEEVKQVGITTRGQLFNAIVPLPGTDNFYIAGLVQLLKSGTVEQDALVLKVSNAQGIQIARAVAGVTGSSESFTDLILRDNNTVVECVGNTTAVPAGSSGLTGTNIYASRMNLSLSNCLGSQVPLQFDARTVTHQVANVISATSDPRVIGVMERTANNTEGASLCNNAKMMEADVEATVSGIALFPNPASGTATLRFPSTPENTTVALMDALGRAVRSYEPDRETLAIDLAGLSPGIYLVAIDQAGQRSTHKLIVR